MLRGIFRYMHPHWPWLTFPVRVSVSQEPPDVEIFDKAIAWVAIAEEKSTTDGSLQTTEN